MTDGMILQINDDGKATLYESTYDITIHCDSEKERREVMERLNSMNWIPVSERLPEEGKRVLATHLGGLNPSRQVIEHIYLNGKFTCGWDMDDDVHSPTFGQRFMGKVVAWMPLPKPYKEGEHE